MCCWASSRNDFYLIVPLKVIDDLDGTVYTKLEVDAKQIIKARSYNNHFGAIFSAFINQFIVIKNLKKLTKENHDDSVLVLPGPNMIMALLSYFLPSNQKKAIFVRGNSLRTVSYMYDGKLLKPLVVCLSKFFKKRLNILQKKSALVFTFGAELRDDYSVHGRSYNIYPLIEASAIKKSKRNQLETDSPIRLIYIGRLSQEKGIIELLSAVNILIERNVVFKLTIAGHGPLESAVLEALSDMGSNPNIEFVGRLSPGQGVLDKIDAANILVVPSKTEGVPRVIAEALARDVAVISTKVGGIEQAFGDSIDYFSGGSPEQLASGLEMLLQTPEHIMSKASIRHDKAQQFTFESNLQKIETILREQFC